MCGGVSVYTPRSGLRTTFCNPSCPKKCYDIDESCSASHNSLQRAVGETLRGLQELSHFDQADHLDDSFCVSWSVFRCLMSALNSGCLLVGTDVPSILACTKNQMLCQCTLFLSRCEMVLRLTPWCVVLIYVFFCKSKCGF